MSKQTWKANHLNGNGHSSINDINDISFILQSTEITTNKQQKLHKNQLKIKIDDLKTFQPLTENQSKFFSLYNEDNSFIMLHGVAGTGKTFCALYKSIEEILMKGKYNESYKRLISVKKYYFKDNRQLNKLLKIAKNGLENKR